MKDAMVSNMLTSTSWPSPVRSRWNSAIMVAYSAAHARHRTDRDVPGIVALGRLYLDHICAHVGHNLSAIGSHDHRGKIDHAQAGQRPGALRGVTHIVLLPGCVAT